MQREKKNKFKKKEMAKSRANGKKKNGIVKLKIAVEKLQKGLFSIKKSPSEQVDDYEENAESLNVPDDVKEGHFAVIALDDNELKRFIIPLSFLTHPSFLRLLEQAAEEYGFDHQGALTIPCRPSKLEQILAEQCVEERGSRVGTVNWGSCSKTMVKSF